MTAATPSDVVMEPKKCPFCSAQPYRADTHNFPDDWEHPWEHKGCILDGFHITDHTAWNRRASDPLRGEMVEALKFAADVLEDLGDGTCGYNCGREGANLDSAIALSKARSALTKAESLNAEGKE